MCQCFWALALLRWITTLAQLHVCEQFISYEFNVNGGGLWCMLVGYGSMLAMGQRVERHNIWWNNIASITIRNSYSYLDYATDFQTISWYIVVFICVDRSFNQLLIGEYISSYCNCTFQLSLWRPYSTSVVNILWLSLLMDMRSSSRRVTTNRIQTLLNYVCENLMYSHCEFNTFGNFNVNALGQYQFRSVWKIVVFDGAVPFCG